MNSNCFNKFKLKVCFLRGRKLLLICFKNIIYYKEISNSLEIEGMGLTHLKRDVDLIKKKTRKILLFKGLGLKANLSKKLKLLNLKLGFSHIIRIPILRGVSIKIRKKFMLFQSSHKGKIGCFVFKIKKLKIPDKYKGKGLWYKNEKLKLKLIKKK